MTHQILLVDDEDSLRLTLAANLELEGFEVVEADCAEQALVLIAERDFDAVLSDVRMPGISGVELFRKIKQCRPQLPTVLMTAFTGESLLEEAWREGVFTILPKPFDPDAAVRALSRAIPRPIVLVVDGEALGAIAVARALEIAGVRAEASADADHALAALATGSVDVCVVEIAEGGGLLDRVASMPAIGVVTIAGDAELERLRAMPSRRAWTCLRRPHDTATLVRAIARVRTSAITKE